MFDVNDYDAINSDNDKYDVENSCKGNNKYPLCPQRMDDGRMFTDYRPRCVANYAKVDANMNSYEYRQYMINNASKLMASNFGKHYNRSSCTPCMEPYNTGTMLPEINNVTCNKSTCKVIAGDKSGLGQGRKYGNMSEKQSKFIDKNTKLSDDSSCVYTFDDPLYHSYDKEADLRCLKRAMNPSGDLPICEKNI